MYSRNQKSGQIPNSCLAMESMGNEVMWKSTRFGMKSRKIRFAALVQYSIRLFAGKTPNQTNSWDAVTTTSPHWALKRSRVHWPNPARLLDHSQCRVLATNSIERFRISVLYSDRSDPHLSLLSSILSLTL